MIFLRLMFFFFPFFLLASIESVSDEQKKHEEFASLRMIESSDEDRGAPNRGEDWAGCSISTVDYENSCTLCGCLSYLEGVQNADFQQNVDQIKCDPCCECSTGRSRGCSLLCLQLDCCKGDGLDKCQVGPQGCLIYEDEMRSSIGPGGCCSYMNRHRLNKECRCGPKGCLFYTDSTSMRVCDPCGILAPMNEITIGPFGSICSADNHGNGSYLCCLFQFFANSPNTPLGALLGNSCASGKKQAFCCCLGLCYGYDNSTYNCLCFECITKPHAPETRVMTAD